MKKYITYTLLLFTITSFSQQDYEFGEPLKKEIEMKFYSRDTTASAVVLHEEGETTFFDTEDRVYIKTTIYRKIKIFKKDAFDYADVEISLYNNKEVKEEVKNIKAIIHNGNNSVSLSLNNVYEEKTNDNRSKIKFALPNIKEGSIIEYTYQIESPFLYNFKGWSFQDEIPTIKSVFKAEIPGNYKYNRTLTGFERLVKNESTVKRNCFSVSGYSGQASCEVLTYSMEHVPAFIEEDYMTSTKNYISRIKFELSEIQWFDGSKKKYTKTWKAVDRDFKTDKSIGGQLKKKTFFKKVLPESISAETDILLKAKKVYNFIQNHYSWNERFDLFNDMNVSRAFGSKVGSVGEINLSLINALRACDIDTELVLLSTRNNGYPTKLHPVISDFNYIIAKIEIGGEKYYLDATDKNLPFGILPYRCLNKEVRVMDFKNGSYWEPLSPRGENFNKSQLLLKLTEDGVFEGNMRVIFSGYSAIEKRKKIKEISKEKYLIEIEDNNDNIEIESYKNSNLHENEDYLKEEFKLTIESDNEIGDNVYLNPFFIDTIDENPFKLNSRRYPVDYGYPRQRDYIVTIIIPDSYSIVSLPKNKIVQLPNNTGRFIYKISANGSKISLNYSFVINQIEFNSNDYLYLKEFYKLSIIAKQELITLKKK